MPPATNGIEGVSVSAQGTMQRVSGGAASLIQRIARKTATAFKPTNILIPGGEVSAQAAQKLAVSGGKAAESIGDGVKTAATSAAKGIEKGATILVLVAGLALVIYFWPVIRPLFSVLGRVKK